MYIPEIFANFARSRLAAAAGPWDNTLTVLDGEAFPVNTKLTNGFFRVVIANAGDEDEEGGGEEGGGGETEWEVCRCLFRTGNILGVERGQEGTAPRAWPAGSKVELRLTAGALARLQQAIVGGGFDD
jgi:hypothetical protein